VFERAKTFNALDRAATVISVVVYTIHNHYLNIEVTELKHGV
jgi:hypothetical protein